MKYILFYIFLTLNISFGQGPIWNKSNDIRSNLWFSNILYINENKIFIAASLTNYNQLHFSNNNGLNWIQIDIPRKINGINTLLYTKENSLLMGTANSSLFRSTDDGLSWENSAFLPPIVTCLAQAKNGDIFAGTIPGDGGMVYVSTNDGRSWKARSNGIWREFINDIEITKDDIIYISTKTGVYYSLDNGEKWLSTSLSSISIYSLASNEAGEIFAVSFYGDVFYSKNNGKSWYKFSLDHKLLRIYDLVISNDGILYAATGANYSEEKYGGVYQSIDNGLSWNNIGLKNTYVTALAINPENKLFAGTLDGFYYTNYSINSRAVGDIELISNFPNPFNDYTNLYFIARSVAPVKIRIYNLLGQLIYETNYEITAAGNYCFTWYPEKSGSGVYFIILANANTTATLKILLVK